MNEYNGTAQVPLPEAEVPRPEAEVPIPKDSLPEAEVSLPEEVSQAAQVRVFLRNLALCPSIAP